MSYMIILDTSFVVSYKIEDDTNHRKAVELMKEIAEGKYGEVIISDYIFDEAVTVILVRSKSLSLAVETGNDLRKYANIDMIGCYIVDSAWEVFSGQKDTKFSFTDCTILSMMERKKIVHIATFDAEFRKMKSIIVVS